MASDAAAADPEQPGEQTSLLARTAPRSSGAGAGGPAAASAAGGAGTSSQEQRFTDGGQAKAVRRWRCSVSPKALLGLVLVALVVVCLHYFSAERLHTLFTSLQGDPLTSAVLFFIFNALGVVFMLPGMVLSIGAGAVFGFWRGAVLSWVATSVGTTLAFVLGRYLLADTVEAYVKDKFPSYPTVETALAKEGWKLVLLLKVAPMSPWNVLNYVMSATPLSLAAFALPSAVAAIPYVLLFSYMGSVSNDLMSAVKGGHSMHVSMTWIVLAPLLLVFSAGGVIILTRRIMNNSMNQHALIATELELPVSVASAIATSCLGDIDEELEEGSGPERESDPSGRLQPEWHPAHGPGMQYMSVPRRPRVSAPA